MGEAFWVSDLGLLSYNQAWELQKRLALKVQAGGIPEILLLLEHPHVFTLGRHGKKENVLLHPEELRKRGIEFFQVDRGGDVTYHGPGQLVAYFLFLLAKSGVRLFVHTLEKMIQEVLAEFGIEGELREGKAGVWVKDRKICSIGIAVHDGVSQHGLALNVNTDLSFFSLIHPCGDPGLLLTSIAQEINRPLSMSEVKEKVIAQTESYFLKKAVFIHKKELSVLATG